MGSNIRSIAGHILAIVAFLGCAATASSAQPYPIGHTSVTFYDPDRADRAIITEIYYPGQTSGDDVPIAQPPPGGFPIVTFGHGFVMVWSAYENIWTALAPEGYVVAFPRTEGGVFPDHLEFGLDLAFLVRQLRSEDADSTSLFYAALDSAAVIMGHSMGGGAAFLAASSETTVSGLATLAAAETNPSAIQAAGSIEAQSVVFSGSYDVVTPPGEHQVPMYQALSSPCKTFISITGGSHCQFAEYNFNCSLGEIGAPEPLVTRDEQHALVNQFLVPWLDFVLRGQNDSWYGFEDSLLACAAITFTHECSVVPPAPPAVVRIDCLSDSVTINWTPSSFATLYHVYSSASAHAAPQAWQLEQSSSDTSWSGTAGGEQRFYRVTASKE